MNTKVRNHNEYFRTVSLNNRKSCPNCKKKLPPNEYIWSWGQYIYGKWNTVMHFCRQCYDSDVKQHLLSHADECGCTITLKGYNEILPEWMEL